MANQGLKSYTKQISQDIGMVATASVNVNKTDANLHIIVPLISTLGPNPMDLELIFNYQNMRYNNRCGKGCRLNYYKEFSDGDTSVRVYDADGSSVRYDLQDGAFISKESNLKIYRDSEVLEDDTEVYTHIIEDEEENRIVYGNVDSNYPTSIEYKNQDSIIFNNENMDNGYGAQIKIMASNDKINRINYHQDGVILYYVNLEYNAEDQLVGVKQYKESTLVKHLSIQYAASYIVVKDCILKHQCKYVLQNERVVQIVEMYNDLVASERNTYITYEVNKTKLQNQEGEIVYIYFDSNNFPLFEIDQYGNAVETKYDPISKKLYSQSSVVPVKDKLPNLKNLTIADFKKDSGIKSYIKSVDDSVLSGVLNEVYCVGGTGKLTYEFYTEGLATDNIMLVLWGKQGTPFTYTSYVKVSLTADGTRTGYFTKTSIDNNYEMMTLGISAVKSYSKISITITLEGNASIDIGGIQLIKKDFGAFYQYDENGNVTEIESGIGSLSSTYNSKGLKESYLGKDSAYFDFQYDSKGNLTSTKTAYGTTINHTYDSRNNITKSSIKNRNGLKCIEVKREYENGRFLKLETDGLGNKTKYTYDSFGKIKKIVDATGGITEFNYDAYDNLISLISNENETVRYTYTETNLIQSITTANNLVYHFYYDDTDRLNCVKMNDTKIVSYVYDQKTGLLLKQTYGESDKTFEFVYNDKHNIEQIKLNNTVLYRYMYDVHDQLITIKDGNENTLKSFSYNSDSQVIKAENQGLKLEYQYDNLGNLIQRKRNLNSKNRYESFDSISRSKGFHPEAVSGYLTKNPHFVGSIFDKDATLKNEEYEVKANQAHSVLYQGFIPCILAGGDRVLSYTLPMNNQYPLDTGCVGFWFYPTENQEKYLFSIKDPTGNSCLSVMMNSEKKLSLDVKDMHNNSYHLVTSQTYVELNNWNFFGLSFMNRNDGNGYSDVCEYALFLNSDVQIYKKENPRLYVEIGSGDYYIGSKYDGSLTNRLNSNITALMIGCKSYSDVGSMQEYFRITKEYIFGLYYLESKAVQYSMATAYDISEDILNQFDIFPLHNSVTSLNSLKPCAFDVRSVTTLDKDRTFNYNNEIKRYAYIADGSRLEYDLGISSTATLFMNAFIINDVEDKQYFFEFLDPSDEVFGLYRGEDQYLYIQYRGETINTNLLFSSKKWHKIGFTMDEEEGSSGLAKKFIVYLDGETFYCVRAAEYDADLVRISIGKRFYSYETNNNIGTIKTSYPLLGQIEMMAINDSYSSTDVFTRLTNGMNCANKVSEYDELGMLNKVRIRNKNQDILSNSFTYKSTGFITKKLSPYIKSETIHFGNQSTIRTYETNEIGNVKSITDEVFGSHTYQYFSCGYLKQADSDQFFYDENGNITKAGNTEFKYDSTIEDRLIFVNDKEIKYEGDDPLNPTSYDGNTYIWQGRRLIKVNDFIYTYDEQGLRISKEVNHQITNYYYEGDKLITEISPEYRLDFLYDENNQVYGFIKDNVDKYFYIKDFMKNILGIIDCNGNLVVKYEYKAYGEIISITGDLATTIGAYNPFRYKGYYYDNETGLYLVTTRYYNPEWCRFISPDSIEYLDPNSINGMNLYAYCNNDPINKYDPTGHFAISLTLLGLIIGAVVGATAGGVVAYDIAKKSGAEGWELAGWTLLGVVGGGIVGGALGAGAGALVTKATGIVGLSITKYSILPIKSVTVLGHMPGYITAATATGSGYYLISDGLWESLDATQRWLNNMQYIKDANALGSQFALVPDFVVRTNGTLWQEIQYLIEHGIPWTFF